jgi:hypothetical protein
MSSLIAEGMIGTPSAMSFRGIAGSASDSTSPAVDRTGRCVVLLVRWEADRRRRVIVALATGWLDSAILLIKRALSQAPPSRSSFRKLATAEPCNDAPGWYLVQRRLSANELEFISEGNLAYGSGGHAAQAELLLREQQALSLACCEAADRETEIQANLTTFNHQM